MVFRRAKRQLNSAAATKTSERLRSYAAAESLGTLADAGEPCVPATWNVYFAQGGVGVVISRRVSASSTAFARSAKTLSEKLCGGSVTHTGAATLLVLGEVVSERGAVGVPEGEKAAEWHRDTKTSKQRRPYATAELIGSLAGEGRTLRAGNVERTFCARCVDWQ